MAVSYLEYTTYLGYIALPEVSRSEGVCVDDVASKIATKTRDMLLPRLKRDWILFCFFFRSLRHLAFSNQRMSQAKRRETTTLQGQERLLTQLLLSFSLAIMSQGKIVIPGSQSIRMTRRASSIPGRIHRMKWRIPRCSSLG